MKALTKLTNTEKAKLLHELFPDEIPLLLEHLKKVCSDFQTHKEAYALNWDNGFMPFDYWLGLSEQTAELLKKHGHSMLRSSRVFSDQLFYTYTALFVNDRIVKFADHICDNEKFKQAVKLLYHTETGGYSPQEQLDELRRQLLAFEYAVIDHATFHLKRIGRTIQMDEFGFVPFNENVSPHIHALRLDEEQQPVLEGDYGNKLLYGFISDNEIDHWDMIALLGLLMDIPSGTATHEKGIG